MAVRKVSDLVSSRIFDIVTKSKRKKFSAFTLAELIVTVSVLAVLISLGFVFLSWYLSDARESASKTNVRSVYAAISAESAAASVSPRYFIVHDPAYALTGTAYVVFGSNLEILSPGDWNVPGTNYSAGNPDWVKLKMNPEKFRVSSGLPSLSKSAFAATDHTRVLAWAADVIEAWSKSRTRSYVQVAGLLSWNSAFVVGNYPVALSGSVSGLVKDLTNPSSTGALVDGVKTGPISDCASQTISDYSIPPISNEGIANVSKTISNGSVSAVFACSFGILSLISEVPSCDSGFVPSGLSCTADVCSSTIPSNAISTATSQSLSNTWHFSITPGECTFACSVNHSWDGFACQANCVASVQTVNAHSYSVPALNHGVSVSPASVVAVSNGSRTYQQSFLCTNGTVATTGPETNTANACNSGYAWNGSSCVANSWSSWSWGACSGETGTWWYSAWGTCSVTCGGWTQSRTASCTRNGNGTQTRTVQCLRYDGSVLADSNCLATKPGSSQSCTQGTDAVCWTVGATSQACNTQSCATYAWTATATYCDPTLPNPAWTICSSAAGTSCSTYWAKCYYFVWMYACGMISPRYNELTCK